MENDLEQVAAVIITSKALVNNYKRRDLDIQNIFQINDIQNARILCFAVPSAFPALSQNRSKRFT